MDNLRLIERFKYLLVGFVCGSLFFSGLALGLSGGTSIEVVFRPLQYFFDGQQKQPEDEFKGFIYKQRLYLSAKFISESMGKPIVWDGAANAVYVGSLPLVKPTPVPTPKPTPKPSLTDTAGLQIFPASNAWNTDISKLAVHANSTQYLTSIGLNTGLHADFGTVWEGAPIGIPYTIVNGTQPKVEITFTDYGDESDPGPYPIPLNAPIEGGAGSDGDRHVLVVDRDNKMLYELFNARPTATGWEASGGAKWDLTSNTLRTKYWTSADAAGLPIFPGLVRYDEAASGLINHAVRFTVSRTQRGFIHPATHFASSSTDANLAPMGLRVRLRADYDISGYSKINQAILNAMKKYGMIVADNGSNWYVSGAPDSRWDDEDLHELGNVKGKDFEVVHTGIIER